MTLARGRQVAATLHHEKVREDMRGLETATGFLSDSSVIEAKFAKSLGYV